MERAWYSSSMELFASRRERRFWLLAAAVVVVIYATLGFAGTLAAELADERRLLDNIFFWSFVVIVATILTEGLTRRPRLVEAALAAAVAGAGLILVIRTGIPAAERTHLVEYGVVGVLVYEALSERVAQGRQVRLPAVTAILVTSFVGVLDECVQALLPDRVFDPVDMAFNAGAAALAVGAAAGLRRLRGRGSAEG